MPTIATTFPPLEWRQLAGDHADPARGFIISAELFESLAQKCLQMTRPE